MKAWRVDQHGGNEVLKWEDIPTSSLSSKDVLIDIKAVGLNHLDLWVRKGVPGHRFPLPMTLGCDCVGIVKKIGPDVDKTWLGRRVLVSPMLPNDGILGETRDGGLAEELCVSEENLIELPESLNYESAACLPIPYLTAYSMLVKKAQLQKNQWILIHAAGSGVSVACIQLARWIGAHVVVTSQSEEKLEKAKKLGVDDGVLIEKADSSFREKLKPLLKKIQKRGFDVVVDHIGEKTFHESLRCVDWGGRLVTCGATSGSRGHIDLNTLFFKNISILGTTMGIRTDLDYLVGLAARGVIDPIIDTRFPFSRLPEAFDRLEQRRVFGKLVLMRE